MISKEEMYEFASQIAGITDADLEAYRCGGKTKKKEAGGKVNNKNKVTQVGKTKVTYNSKKAETTETKTWSDGTTSSRTYDDDGDGTVYKGRRKKDNKIVSIKEYKRYQDRAIETYEKDVKYMEELKSDYTIKKIDVKQTNNYSYIIREYCYGSLEEFIKSHDDGMKPFEIQKILNQLIEPFKKLNEQKLIH